MIVEFVSRLLSAFYNLLPTLGDNLAGGIGTMATAGVSCFSVLPWDHLPSGQRCSYSLSLPPSDDGWTDRQVLLLGEGKLTVVHNSTCGWGQVIHFMGKNILDLSSKSSCPNLLFQDKKRSSV